MTWVTDTTELVSGGWLASTAPGHGLLGAVIRATTGGGESGPGFLYNDLSPADDAKEIRGLVLTLPSAGSFFAFEDGSFDLIGAPDGSYSITYRLFVDGVDSGTATSTIVIGTVTVVAPVNSAAPTIAGIPIEGATLTASTGAWTGSPTGYAYRWFRGGTPISGATAATYTLTLADVGSQIRVGVIASNTGGASSEALSVQTSAVTPAVTPALAPSNTAVPVVSGALTQGATVSTTAGSWANTPTSFTYRWFRGGTVIAGAVNSTYTLVLADVGSTIRSGVVASNTAGASAEAFSAATAAVSGVPTGPAVVGTIFTDWLDRVLPYAPGCPEDTALLHIIDAAKEFCRRTLAYNYQHEAIPTVAGQGAYLLTLPEGLRLAKVMGCQIGDGAIYAVQGGSLGRSLQRNLTGNVCLLEDPRTIVLTPVPTQAGLPIVVDIAVMPTDAGTAVWPDSLEDHIEYIAAGAIGSLCAMPEKAAAWRDLQSSIDNRAKFNSRIAALKVQLSRSEVWSARAKTVWF